MRTTVRLDDQLLADAKRLILPNIDILVYASRRDMADRNRVRSRGCPTEFIGSSCSFAQEWTSCLKPKQG